MKSISSPASSHGVLVIAGLTASGKSQLAIDLAERLDAEIVAADSVALYKGFDIGSAKPAQQDQRRVTHHMIDILDPSQRASSGMYMQLARKAIADIHSRDRLAIVVGGSALYIRSLLGENFHELPHDPSLRAELCQKSPQELYVQLRELDPQRACELHPNDHFRLARACEIALLTGKTMQQLTQSSCDTLTCGALSEYQCLSVVIQPPKIVSERAISRRVDQMLAAGLCDEVKGLLAKGVRKDVWAFSSVGYKQVLDHFHRGQTDLRSLREAIIIATRQLAKKQRRVFGLLPFHMCFEQADFPSLLVALENSPLCRYFKKSH
ncbi:MAG: tRNA (adenosine(37)-N6)-dimethylallyltransferase MiaA [Proteobacteria bacterium]|nr:tRNA (adenosine(37)-N6)-dimethylallyltransferase MiaA [Pseudomonadota bacterium]